MDDAASASLRVAVRPEKYTVRAPFARSLSSHCGPIPRKWGVSRYPSKRTPKLQLRRITCRLVDYGRLRLRTCLCESPRERRQSGLHAHGVHAAFILDGVWLESIRSGAQLRAVALRIALVDPNAIVDDGVLPARRVTVA